MKRASSLFLFLIFISFFSFLPFSTTSADEQLLASYDTPLTSHDRHLLAVSEEQYPHHPYSPTPYTPTSITNLGSNLIHTYSLCPTIFSTSKSNTPLTLPFAGGWPHVNLTSHMAGADPKNELYDSPARVSFTVFQTTFDNTIGEFVLMGAIDFLNSSFSDPYHQYSLLNNGFMKQLYAQFYERGHQSNIICVDSVTALLIPATRLYVFANHVEVRCHYPLHPQPPPINLTLSILHVDPSVLRVPYSPPAFDMESIQTAYNPSLADDKLIDIEFIKKFNLISSQYTPQPQLLAVLSHRIDPNSQIFTAIKSHIGGHMHLAICSHYSTPVTTTMCIPPLLQPNQATLLTQFINYHAYMGIERFMVYDRWGTYASIVEKYVDSGLVEYIRFPPFFDKSYIPNVPLYDRLIALEHCRISQLVYTQWLTHANINDYIIFPSSSSITKSFPSNCIQVSKSNDQLIVLKHYPPPTKILTDDIHVEYDADKGEFIHNSNSVPVPDLHSHWSTGSSPCNSPIQLLLKSSMLSSRDNWPMRQRIYLPLVSTQPLLPRLPSQSTESIPTHKTLYYHRPSISTPSTVTFPYVTWSTLHGVHHYLGILWGEFIEYSIGPGGSAGLWYWGGRGGEAKSGTGKEGGDWKLNDIKIESMKLLGEENSYSIDIDSVEEVAQVFAQLKKL